MDGKAVIVLFLSACFVLIASRPVLKQASEPYPLPDTSTFPALSSSANEPTKKGFILGRYLFYDPILSADSSLSCAGCHRQEAAFSDGPNRFSKGNNDVLQHRNTPPLFNLAWYDALFWDGRSSSIEEQVFVPVRAHEEMNLDWPTASDRIRNKSFYTRQFYEVFGDSYIDSNRIAEAIGQFERALISINSKYDGVIRGDEYFTKDEYQGFILVNEQDKGNCLQCHPTDGHALATTGGFSDNGIQEALTISDYSDVGRSIVTGNERDAGKFKIPSLRNLSFTAPYMHNGSLKDLDEVLKFYNEEIHHSPNLDAKMGPTLTLGVQLTKEELEQVRAFLLTLNDSDFVSNPEFADPFQ